VSYQTTIGWSLIVSGLTTLLIEFLRYDAVYWGLGLLAVGILVFVLRRAI
jgi:hypothetical protein